VADEGSGSARACGCQAAAALPRLLTSTGIPERYMKCDFEHFEADSDDPGQHDLVRAKKLCARFVEEFVDPATGKHRERGLLLVGPCGVGKTHLVVAVLLQLIRDYRVRAKFRDFTSLCYEIQATFDSSSQLSKHDVVEPIMNADVLVLDELGAQKPSPWAQDVLYLILNHRYNRRLPTLFTTNYSLSAAPREAGDLDRPAVRAPRESLSARIPAALISRLFEMTQVVRLEAVDFRQEVRSHANRL